VNCIEFRRRLLIDPTSQAPDLLEHEAGCPDCAPFARETRAQEIRLRALLNSVSPPQGLGERIRLAARFEHAAARRRQFWYAAAASVFLAVGISLSSLLYNAHTRTGLELARSVINHIEDEAHHLREANAVPMARVRFVLRRFGADLLADIGPVNFAAECLMRQRTGVHLVLPGRHGPITVFYMPGEMLNEQVAVESPRFRGYIVPTTWGSVAVVGEEGEPIEGLGQRLAAAVSWPAQSARFDSGRRLGARFDHAAQQQDG
jgi:hypothetical protein